VNETRTLVIIHHVLKFKMRYLKVQDLQKISTKATFKIYFVVLSLVKIRKEIHAARSVNIKVS